MSEESKALGLTDEQMAEYKEAFALFDTKGHGSISVDQLQKAMKEMGLDVVKDELLSIVSVVDSDGTGELDFPQFLKLMSIKCKLTNEEEELQEAFKLFNGGAAGSDGFAGEELKRVLTTLGEKLSDDEVQEMMQEADKDKDGKISFDEFKAMMSPDL